MSGKQVHPNTQTKITDWAREYGKHFCLHDVMGFFSQIPEANIGGALSHMAKNGIITTSFNKERCRMCDRNHTFYIYHEYKSKPPPEPVDIVIPPKNREVIPQTSSKPKRHWYTKQERKKVKELYASGKNREQIAKELGVPFNSLRKMMERRHITKGKRSRKVWTKGQINEILYRLKKGESFEEIAKVYGVSPYSIQGVMYRGKIVKRRKTIAMPESQKAEEQTSEVFSHCPLCNQKLKKMIIVKVRR